MDLQLKDKIVIVSGGAKGIGEGIVRSLAAEGAVPVIIGRNENDNKKLFEELLGKGYKAGYVTAELTDPKENKRAVDKVLEQFKRIDGVVNNAGVNDGVGLENG